MTIRHPSLTKEKVPFPCPEQTFVNMNLEIEKKSVISRTSNHKTIHTNCKIQWFFNVISQQNCWTFREPAGFESSRFAEEHHRCSFECQCKWCHNCKHCVVEVIKIGAPVVWGQIFGNFWSVILEVNKICLCGYLRSLWFLRCWRLGNS